VTDARLQGRWLTDPVYDQLSDRAWRTWTGSLMWCAEHGTDGKLAVRSLRLLHPDGTDEATVAELVCAGKWIETPTGYEVADWAGSAGQSLAADVRRQREANRIRQARWRERQISLDQDPARDVTRYVTRESPGQARQGSAVEGELYETSALNIASATGCEECQRLAGFGRPPCPRHRPAALSMRGLQPITGDGR
jgi:hypothetical protein